MKYPLVVLLVLLASLTSLSQINQISIGLGRTDQWGTSFYTNIGDTAIAYETQLTLDSRTTYVITLDQTLNKLNLYHVLSFNVMYPGHSIRVPSTIRPYATVKTALKVPTFEYSINTRLLNPSRHFSILGGLNIRGQWPVKGPAYVSSDALADLILDAYNSIAPITMGINLNLRYQTRWLRVELGYIGDITSSTRDFEHNGQIVPMGKFLMNKMYLVFSGPVFRREKPPKKLKKKDFIKN